MLQSKQMKFGFRTPSLTKRISARTSLKRIVRSKVRVPRGAGIFTNPKKAVYNRVYNRTTFGIGSLGKGSSLGCLTFILIGIPLFFIKLIISLIRLFLPKKSEPIDLIENDISSTPDRKNF